MEQVRLWQSGNGLLKRLVSVPRAQCLPLAGPAAGAGGRKGTGVAEPSPASVRNKLSLCSAALWPFLWPTIK